MGWDEDGISELGWISSPIGFESDMGQSATSTTIQRNASDDTVCDKTKRRVRFSSNVTFGVDSILILPLYLCC